VSVIFGTFVVLGTAVLSWWLARWACTRLYARQGIRKFEELLALEAVAA
jgi:hypothetical protein